MSSTTSARPLALGKPPGDPVAEDIKLHSKLVQRRGTGWGLYSRTFVTHIKEFDRMRENMNTLYVVASFVVSIYGQSLSASPTLPPSAIVIFYAGGLLNIFVVCVALFSVSRLQYLHSLLVRHSEASKALIAWLDKADDSESTILTAANASQFVSHIDHTQRLLLRIAGDPSSWGFRTQVASLDFDFRKSLRAHFPPLKMPTTLQTLVDEYETSIDYFHDLGPGVRIALAASVLLPNLVIIGACSLVVGRLIVAIELYQLPVWTTSLAVLGFMVGLLACLVVYTWPRRCRGGKGLHDLENGRE